MKRFQAPISVIAYSYAFGTIMMGIASYFLVEDSSAWVLHWDIGLLAVLYNVSPLHLYSGIWSTNLGSCFRFQMAKVASLLICLRGVSPSWCAWAFLQGIISSALNFALMSWALSKVGPLFVASYIPVQPVSAAILALFFLKSTVYLGRWAFLWPHVNTIR